MANPAYTPDPEGWYDAYGWHLTPDDPYLPDFPLQVVSYEDAADPRAASRALRAEHPMLTEAGADRIAERAAEVRQAGDMICSLLERAAAATGSERESLLAEAARAESEHGATPETDRARRALGGEAPRHTVATPHATCDRCGEEISEAEAEAGWPVASDDGHICPGCYGPEAYCSTCGDVLPAHEEGSRCPSCAKARGGV